MNAFKLCALLAVVAGKTRLVINKSKYLLLATAVDYDGIEKRGGDAMFATGAVGRSFNRMGNYFGNRRAGAGSFLNQARFG